MKLLTSFMLKTVSEALRSDRQTFKKTYNGRLQMKKMMTMSMRTILKFSSARLLPTKRRLKIILLY